VADDELKELIHRENMHEVATRLGGWTYFRKTAMTRMAQLDRDMSIETKHGIVDVAKGDWLAEDAEGYPYPIADTEKELIYQPVEEGRKDVLGLPSH
jgi:hypothetical protein